MIVAFSVARAARFVPGSRRLEKLARRGGARQPRRGRAVTFAVLGFDGLCANDRMRMAPAPG